MDGFHEFMCEKFKVPSNRNSLDIAEFYSKNQAQAFDLWFDGLEEFLSKEDGTSALEKYYTDRRNGDLLGSRRELDFFGFVKMISKRISAFVGRESFTLFTLIILGWLRATDDFDFVESEQEKTFKSFQKYIEEKPFWLRAEGYADLPPTPTWDKIIWFRTAHDSIEEKALETFVEYFDEFAFQEKGFIEYVEFHWKTQLEHQKDCHIIKGWKTS